MKPKAEKWKRCNHGVRLAERDPNTDLSHLRFADDSLLISGSLKHTTTMLDDFITATAHGLQLHTTKTGIISTTTSKTRKNNTVTVQGMNIEFLPPEGKIKCLQVEFEHRIKCACGNVHEPQAGVDVTKVPIEGQTQTLRRHSGTRHPSTYQERGR